MDSNRALFQHCRNVRATSRLPIPSRSRDGEGGPNMVEVYGHLKMGYSDGAYDSKAWPEITHFKVTGESFF